MRKVELKIDDVAFGGSGVGRDDGKAVFIPYTIDGELVSAKITREKKQFAEAEVVRLRESSPHRVDPPCPYFRKCGGCAYQHIDYAHQLEIKSRQVRDVLRRIGKLDEVPLRPIIPSPRAYSYRNRITVHAQDGVIGYFERDSHQLIDVERCPIATDEVNRDLTDLRARDVPDGHYTLRASRTHSASGSGEPTARRENAFRHFTQTNDAVAAALRDLVVKAIPSGQELLIDAYCGAGFFAKALLPKFERIIGIDWNRYAIAAAKEDATARETYIAGDVQLELDRINSTGFTSQVSTGLGESKITLIVDPPAIGLDSGVREALLNLAPATLFYISCNPATLARDLSHLRQRFEIDSVTPLDMFPQTAEIEVVAQLSACPP